MRRISAPTLLAILPTQNRLTSTSYALNSESASSFSIETLDPTAPSSKVIAMSVWSPQQHAYRNILRSLRGAYYNDRARLFWARHFARVEFYKYAEFVGEGDIRYKEKQEKLAQDMLKAEGEQENMDLEEMLGMGSTSSEELAAANKEDPIKQLTIPEGSQSESKIPISTSAAVGLQNESEIVTYTYLRRLSSPSPQHQHLVNISNECADFIHKYMRVSVDRIVEHNKVMMSLSVSDAKKFRKAYLLREEQHESWCKQKIKQILERRPVAPYPYC